MAPQTTYINKVILTGLLVRDPEYRHTTTGAPVSNFRIAATKRFRDSDGHLREEVCYIGVAAWHMLADNCRERLRKGSPVQVEGELKSRVRDAGEGVRRSFVEIRASHVRLFHEDGSQEDLPDAGLPAFAAAPTRDQADLSYDQDGSVFRMPESSTDDFEPVNQFDNDEL